MNSLFSKCILYLTSKIIALECILRLLGAIGRACQNPFHLAYIILKVTVSFADRYIPSVYISRLFNNFTFYWDGPKGVGQYFLFRI